MGYGQKKGWWEKKEEVRTEKGIEKKAPIHRKVAIEKEASTANNTRMQKRGERRSKKPKGYWTYETTLRELKIVIAEIGHFPTHSELCDMGKSNISSAIKKQGGSPKLRETLGHKLLRKPEGYWTYENTLIEIKKIISEVKHVPTPAELRVMNRQDLIYAINKHGGIGKFKEELGYELHRKPNGYWTDENICTELKQITDKHGGEFPTYKEIYVINRCDLLNAIDGHGGINKFRELLGYPLFRKPNRYWTDENICTELKKVISKQGGEFPTRGTLKTLGREDLIGAISNQGGSKKFRELMGYASLRKPWTDEMIIIDLIKIKEELKHFPSRTELILMNRNNLLNQINFHGGFNKFRGALGETPTLFNKYMSDSGAYNSRRGRNTEMLLKNILIGWCKTNGLSEPTYNKRLATHNVIEFVCGTSKTIGIDVTNTKDPSGSSIRKKYLKKDYHKYVDELWIVVFSNVFEKQDYRRFNKESPDNVRVMSIDVFLTELDISTEEHIISKINTYKNCTFHNKDEFVKRHLNTSLDNYIYENTINNNTQKVK